MKFLTLGLMLAAFGAISVSSTYAQATEEVCKPLYEKFLADRKGPSIEIYERAVATGKEFLSKCSDWAGQEEAIKYVGGQVPKIETTVAGLKDTRDIFDPFNKSIPAKDWATAFRTGKLAVNKNPDDVDVPLILASIGFDRAIVDNPPVDTYNADAISMAKLALQKIEQGKGSGTGNFGALGYAYKTKECADGKTNATGWMNYTVGAIMYYRMNQKKEALPYLYKATQTGCETKDRIANVYRTIGNYYIDEFKRLEGEKNAAYEVLSKMKTDDPGFADAEKKYKDLLALQKGYMERIMDAFARAYKSALNAKEQATFANAQLNRAKEFYGFRFGKTPTVTFDAWLAGLSGKPFPDPAVAVTPIVETETTTAPTAMTATTETPTTGTDTRARTVATTNGTKTTTPAATTTTKSASTTTKTTTTKKAPAKKPAPKKKGTR